MINLTTGVYSLISKELNKYNFSHSELRELQLRSLDLILEFKKFCEENDLEWFLCGGGCIGAVRHGGFIPWDDDLDVFMMRKDYERFFSIAKKSKLNFHVIRTSEKIFSRQTFTSVTDKNTTVIKKEQIGLKIPRGISIDVFPLDASPSNIFKQQIQMLNARLFSLYITCVIPKNHSFFISLICFILLALAPSFKLRIKLAHIFEKNMTKYNIDECYYVKELCAGPKYMKNLYKKSLFQKSELKKFENTFLPVPSGYDEYLRLAFGNYMELPPENERINSHDIVFIDLNNPSKKYESEI